MLSHIEVGEASYRLALTEATKRDPALGWNETDAAVPTERQISTWRADGGCCLRVRIVQRGRARPPKRFGVILDGESLQLSQTRGHPLLLAAGWHAIRSATSSTLLRPSAGVFLSCGEDVMATFRGGFLDAQAGGSWTRRLAQTNTPPLTAE